MPLIKESVNEALNALVGDFFAFNRLLDRQMSILGVKFVMPKTSAILHQKLAHQMPLLADKISDYQGSRNNLTIYPETPIGNEDYSTPQEIFGRMLDKQLEVEDVVIETIQLAGDEGDYMTKAFLQDFLLGLNVYTEQMLLLVDKAKMYGDSPKCWMDFDHVVEDFIIV